MSRFRDRVYIGDLSLRHLLKRYAMGGKTVNSKKFNLLTVSEKEDMLHRAEKTSHVLHEFLIDVDNGSLVAEESIKELLLSVSSGSPVCSYVHVNDTVRSIVADMKCGLNIKENPVKWRQMSEEMPIFYKTFTNSCNAIPQCATDLLLELWNKAETTFSACQPYSDDGPIEQSDDLSYFPSLPKLRNRGKYAADLKKNSTSSDTSCTKLYSRHPTLLPGIFTIYCQHGICYGYQMMPSCESPDIPFTILRTRFTKAPSVVVYDNACSLHNYVLNRDPVFFMNTNFYIDRLHWDNHIGCSSGYNLAAYPLFAHINSQVNEQGNAGLKRIKDQLSYMTAANFMKHCTFYMWNKNRLKNLLLPSV